MSDQRRSLLPAGEPVDGGGQVVLAGLDVAPRGLEALVAGQGGDDLEAGSGVGQVLAPGVPQHVGRQLGEPGGPGVFGQGRLDAALGQRPALALEDRLGLARPAEGAEPGQGVAGLDVERDGPLLAALAAAHRELARAVADLQVGPAQRGELGDPQPGVEQERHQGDVAGQAVALDGADEVALLLAVEPAGRRLDLLDRFGGDHLRGQALGGGPAEEGAEGGELAVDGGGLELEGVAEVGLPLAELGGGQRPEVGASWYDFWYQSVKARRSSR